MSTIFHITPRAHWETAILRGHYLPQDYKEEGFIHASLPRQLPAVAERHYKNQKDLVLLEIETELVKSKIVFEGVTDKFPHIYGELNLDSVINIHNFDLKEPPPGTAFVGETYVRPARTQDAGEIANCHLNSWREIYQGLIPKDFLDELPLSFKRRQDFWREHISSGASYVIVAESEQHGVVGFINVGDSRENFFSEYGELRALYLLRKYQDRGIGKKLLQLGFSQLESKGFTSAYCWVLEGNPTIKFYEKTGAKMGSKNKTINLGKEIREVSCEWENLSDYRVNLTQKTL